MTIKEKRNKTKNAIKLRKPNLTSGNNKTKTVTLPPQPKSNTISLKATLTFDEQNGFQKITINTVAGIEHVLYDFTHYAIHTSQIKISLNKSQIIIEKDQSI